VDSPVLNTVVLGYICFRRTYEREYISFRSTYEQNPSASGGRMRGRQQHATC
jgi:hypothetical protein